jgi:hypothetical protein
MMNRSQDEDVLKSIIARLVKTSPHADPILGLEVLDGPYRGVVFSFSTFEVMDRQLDNGMVPTKFNVTIHQAPKDFVYGEAFDEYAREVLLAWLGYISTHNFSDLIQAETTGTH